MANSDIGLLQYGSNITTEKSQRNNFFATFELQSVEAFAQKRDKVLYVDFDRIPTPSEFMVEVVKHEDIFLSMVKCKCHYRFELDFFVVLS